MCGIFAYQGSSHEAGKIVINGLSRLDYRGYDSWGVCLKTDEGLYLQKKPGKLGNPEEITQFLPPSHTAIAHTRWATTGEVNEINAHPHYSTDHSFALAQNGILENYLEIKENLLKKGYRFISQTDTEVIVRLLEDKLKDLQNFQDALRACFLELKGRNTVIIIHQNGSVYAARNGSPLVLGHNQKTNEIYLSSDTLSFAQSVTEFRVIENDEYLEIDSEGQVQVRNVKTGSPVALKFEHAELAKQVIDKAGYPHFMLKEIMETPMVIETIANQTVQRYQQLAEDLKKARQVYVIGSGTAGFAASQIAFYLRVYGQINAISLVGADTRSYYHLFGQSDWIIAPSQSGETADVIEVLEYAKTRGVRVASIVNMPGSMMTRLSDAAFMCQAGPEVCVMSTKVFVSQIAWGYRVAKTVQGKEQEGKEFLLNASKSCRQLLENKDFHKHIQALTKKLLTKRDLFLLAKYQNLAIASEGMVKLVEGTYKHAHAIPAGDLKHYAITLMEKGVPVIALVSHDEVESDLQMAINEVRLRGAEVIAIAHENKPNYDYYLETPDLGETDALGNVLPLQLLAYYLARDLGNNIDKPRNIAKSVTVK